MDVAVRDGRRHRDEPVGGTRGVHHAGDAESWVGEYWKDLLEGGVEQVKLSDDSGTELYTMSLRAALEA